LDDDDDDEKGIHNVDTPSLLVLADICRVLDIGNPSDAARRLDSDEKTTLDNIEGGNINGLTKGMHTTDTPSTTAPLL
jgi:prophage antirepressor-like protein